MHARTDKATGLVYEPEFWNKRLTDKDLEKVYQRHKSLLDAVHMQKHQTPMGDKNDPMARGIDIRYTIQDFMADPNRYIAPAHQKEAANKDFSNVLMDGFKEYANCYTYAINFKNHKFISGSGKHMNEPGDRDRRHWMPESGVKIYDNDAPNVARFRDDVIRRATEVDGLTYIGPDRPSKAHMGASKGGYLIAFYIKKPSPGCRDDGCGFDFHFLRQDKKGTGPADPDHWSGKWGPTTVTELDREGNKITDPKTAKMESYEFVGYFYAPKGGIPSE
jgi:hypothetical protein